MSEKIKIHLNVNGQAIEPQVDPEMSLLTFLREELGLTGTKDGCAEGTCGACTVIVDGKARRSCLLKMQRMDGCRVETVEGLAPRLSPELVEDDLLHPLQYTMVREGAIQCGFCTPGLVMVGKALLDRNPDPSLGEIKKALKHNLCRCTGYRPIIAAIQEAGCLLRDGVNEVLVSELWPAGDQVVGRGVARVDGVDKATGRLKYSADLHVEGMLHAKVLRAAYPHARLLRVDTSAAEGAPGVVAALTAKDVPGRNRFGIIRKDQPVFAEDHVCYLGEVVAAVYAESEAEAEAALSLIQVEYEPLPVIENPQQALAEGATVIHKDNADGNLVCHITIRKGDVKAGFAEADVIIEGEYSTPSIEHAYLEPEACLAVPEVELTSASGRVGGVTVHVGSQSAVHDQEDIAAVLDWPLEKVRVIHMPMGGGFGGKEDITVQIVAALGAVKTGRPVKFVWTRQESLLASGKRHAEWLRYRTGVTHDGRLVAAEVEIYGDGGAYASATDAVLFRSATFSCGPYNVPNVKVDVYGAFTNNPHGSAFRGFGNPQATFAAEAQMDRLAEALGMDPVEFRLKNILDAGDVTITGHLLQHSVGARPTLEAVREALAESGIPAPPPGKRIGVGFATSYKNVGLGSGMEDGAGAHLILQSDGSILLREGAMDMGQGSDTVMVQIAAQTLRVPFNRIRLHVGDTAEDPSGWMTTASRQTFVTGNAVYQAALELRADLCAAVAEELDMPPGQVELANGVFRLVDGGEPLTTLDELATKAAAAGRTFEREYAYVAPQTYPVPEYVDPALAQDPEKTRLHFAYSFAAQAAIVAVDEETNKVEVLKVISASDVGEPINPQGVKGQIEGGILMGLGYGLSEEFRLEAGRPVTDRYARLGLPRVADMPEMVTVSVSDPHPEGPYGAKGMGELPMSPTAAAIANAIYDAVGVRVCGLPITPEKIAAARDAKTK
ncbi:MAG: molybdopterin cofactor-binding domain-containing protein [Chloroflexota bacterium]|nr:molybdopterin cofactor-binding domain-containing protein [Chloroflexota bacterium]